LAPSGAFDRSGPCNDEAAILDFGDIHRLGNKADLGVGVGGALMERDRVVSHLGQDIRMHAATNDLRDI